MHLTLLHNPKAGTGKPHKRELLELFERAGHEVVYQSTKEKGFRRALKSPGELVVAAGGDGTVGKVARWLIGSDLPLAILPLGTANNLARSLGLKGSVERLIGSLARWRAVKFDVGFARGPWGDGPFLEAAGAGLFPRMMSQHVENRNDGVPDAVDAHGGLRGGVKLLRQVLGDSAGHESTIRFDGRTVEGRYLLIEAMNTRTLGPVFELAPRARPGDGWLDLVLIREDQRGELERYLRAVEAGRRRRFPFSVQRARRIELRCAATEFHFDDVYWPDHEERPLRRRKAVAGKIRVEIKLGAGALRMLVPDGKREVR